MVERWLPVPGYEDCYNVSSRGRLQSNPRPGARGGLLSLTINADGYAVAHLSRQGVKSKEPIHKLVALAFLDPRPPGAQVAHGDGNPLNNELSNLRYATPKENTADAFMHGTHRMANRTTCDRGHALEQWNLSQAHLKAGKRTCLACHRERALAASQGRLFNPELATERFLLAQKGA